jgi:hypothetical protein
VSRFVICRVRTAPRELSDQVPVSGYTVDSRTDRNGNGAFFYARLDAPLRYWLPRDFDHARCDPAWVYRDGHGTFLLVWAVVLSAHGLGERPYVGMRNFGVDLAYVIDASLDQDTVVDPAKIEWVGQVEIDDADGAAPSHPTDEHRGEVPVAAPSGAAPFPFAANDFQRELNSWTAALAALAGAHGDDVQAPPRREPENAGVEDGVAFYSLGADVLRYHTWDPLQGWINCETRDPDELLYWIVDDIASVTAWRWAQSTPAYAAMSHELALRTLWMPLWHLLVHALQPEWGRRTRETIRILAHASPHPPPTGGPSTGVHGQANSTRDLSQ